MSHPRTIHIILSSKTTAHWSKQIRGNPSTETEMNKTTFLLFYIVQYSVTIKQIRKNEALKFIAYDCTKPTSLVSYRKSDWCVPNKTHENPKGDKNEEKRITIIQKFGTQNVKGIKCSKRVSKFLLYCGTYSHQKFMGPPSIMVPESMPENECSDMYARKAYIIDGKTMRIGLNQQIQFPEVNHGRIYSDEFNVHCEGAKITINGEQHERMLELRSVTISMSEIDVEISPGRVIDIQNNVELEQRCIEYMKCSMGIDTYLILEKPDHCQLAKIQSMTVNEIRLNHKGNTELYLVNDDHRIIIRQLDKQKSEECDITYFTTDYPELMIVLESQETALKFKDVSTHPDSINLDLELRMSEEYLHYQMEVMLQATVHEVQQHLCMIGANSLHQMERSPLHPNALIRDRGDIIQEMQCRTVEVTSSPGYQRHDKCSKEYLPVYLGEEPVYLNTAKLITIKPILDLLDCDEVFPPIFEATNGVLAQAAPSVQPISLQLSKPEQLGYHVDELEHVEETDSLLYTHKEMQAYMELFHAKRSSKAITYALTAQYCANPGTCGEYQPTGTLGFDFNNLAQNTLRMLDWKSYLLDTIDAWGRYASCVVVIYLIGKLTYVTMGIVMTRRRGVDWITAVKLNMFLMTEFRNNLIHNLQEPEVNLPTMHPPGIELEEIH